MAYVNNQKEVNNMPRRDGTGPKGNGSMTGRGIGICSGINAEANEAGFGMRSGFARRCGSANGSGRDAGNGARRGAGNGAGRGSRRGSERCADRGIGQGFRMNQANSKSQVERLNEQKEMLESKLEVIERQLANL